jgi:adenylate cyclase
LSYKNHVWAERYDRALVDLFAVQDEITRSIIGAIAPGIVMAEIQHSKGKTATELDTWDRIMRATGTSGDSRPWTSERRAG